MAHHRATRAEIDLQAFQHNLQTLRKYLDPQTQIMAVVKADAYGHGAIPCARIAVENGADYLGAGVIEEGIELRENGLNAPILILGSIFPDEAEDLSPTQPCNHTLHPASCPGSFKGSRKTG